MGPHPWLVFRARRHAVGVTQGGLRQLPSSVLSSSGQLGARPSLQPEPAQEQLERPSPVFLLPLRLCERG